VVNDDAAAAIADALAAGTISAPFARWIVGEMRREICALCGRLQVTHLAGAIRSDSDHLYLPEGLN
jgi:hypothetical protein